MQEAIKWIEEEIEKLQENKSIVFWEIRHGKRQGLQRAIEIIRESENNG
jgi:predicted adenine nucleotide alpha hydrolase (AANH) superfamily ATPase